jgi:anti-sigma B factor antagonist
LHCPESTTIIHRRKVKMEITTKQLKRVDVVTVSGRVDSSTAPELESVLQSIVDADRFRICMDLENLEYLSSAGIKVLISTLKACKRWNRGDVRLANVPPYIAEVFELAGLTPLFKTYPNLVEAVGSF